MDERREYEPPPSAVGRARTDVRAPRDERLRMSKRPVAEDHREEHDHVQRDEERGDDRESRARAKRVVKRLAVAAISRDQAGESLRVRAKRTKDFRALVRRRDAIDETGEHTEHQNPGHEGRILKRRATRPSKFKADSPI